MSRTRVSSQRLLARLLFPLCRTFSNSSLATFARPRPAQECSVRPGVSCQGWLKRQANLSYHRYLQQQYPEQGSVDVYSRCSKNTYSGRAHGNRFHMAVLDSKRFDDFPQQNLNKLSILILYAREVTYRFTTPTRTGNEQRLPCQNRIYMPSQTEFRARLLLTQYLLLLLRENDRKLFFSRSRFDLGTISSWQFQRKISYGVRLIRCHLSAFSSGFRRVRSLSLDFGFGCI